MRKSVAFALLLGVMSVTSCRRSTSPGETEASSQGTNAVMEVEIVPAEERPVARQIEIVGTLLAEERVTVASEVEGRLAEIRVDLGSSVRQGDVLAVIDRRDFELRLADAQAALRQVLARLGMTENQDRVDPQETTIVRQAKASFDDAALRLQRLRQLRSKGVVSQQEYDQAEAAFRIAEARYHAALEEVNTLLAQLEQRRAQVALARRELEKTIIRSPLTGAVVERHVSAGEMVRRNDRVVTLVTTNPLRLRADVPERYAAQVYVGRPLTFTIDALPGRTFTGRIVRLSPAVSTETRSLTLEAEIENRNNDLRPGYFARAQVVVDPRATAVVVPARAVTAYVGIYKVFVVDGDKAVERQVKPGMKLGEWVEIVEGIRPGDPVIVSDVGRLYTGARVRPRSR